MGAGYQLSHLEVVNAITKVARPVMAIALGKIITVEEMPHFQDDIRLGVIEVMKHYKHDLGSIEALATWPPVIRDAEERARLVFIALVLNLYN